MALQKEEKFEDPLEHFPKLKELVSKCKSCVDCDATDPKWADVNHGTLICKQCAGVHRSLGTHISFVQSITLDYWSQDKVDKMVDNTLFNQEWEYYVPSEFIKPRENSSREIREKYIRAKYGEPKVSSNKNNNTKEWIVKPLFKKEYNLDKITKLPVFDILSNSSDSNNKSNNKSNNNDQGMINYNGILTIHIESAKKLPNVDLLSESDPYVVFDSGTQKVKTKVIQDNNNPTWNQTLILSVQENTPIKIEVYDEDSLTKDDLICYTYIDIKKQCIIDQPVKFQDLPMTLADNIKSNSKHVPQLTFTATYTKMSV